MIEFTGVDVLIKEPIDEKVLARALGAALSVDEEGVLVLEAIEDSSGEIEEKVVILRYPVGGDYSILASVNSELIEIDYDSIIDLGERIVILLGCECLIPSDGVDPYQMWCLRPAQGKVLVGIDPREADENRYILKRQS